MSDHKAEPSEDGSPASKRIKLNNSELQQSPSDQKHYDTQQLKDFADSLNVPDDVYQLALTMWADLVKRKYVAGREKKFFVCLVYIASIDLRLPYGSGDPAAAAGHLSPAAVTVSDLLAKSSMSVRQMIGLVKDIRDCRHLSATYLEHFLNMERKYCVSYALFIKFEKMFEEIFQQNGSSNGFLENGNARNIIPYDYHAQKKLCWMLFVYLKGKSLGKVGEFLTPFGLLLCCLDLVMAQTASVWLKTPFNNIELLEVVGSQQRFLATLCEKYGATFDEVSRISDSYFLPFKTFLPLKEGFLDCDALCQLYMDVYKREGDINELLFLSHDPVLIPPDLAINKPENLNPPMTPVRHALSTVRQLQNLLTSASDQPSQNLLRFFQNCTLNPLPGIQAKIEVWREKFVRELESAYGSPSVKAGEKFTMALRLYYRVMESLLTQEEERLSRGDFSHLLANMLFHASLLACSAQIVLHTYNLSGSSKPQSPSLNHENLQFPWILNVLEVPAYDFYKVLESYILAERMLSKDAVKHLHQIETSILESLAWQSGSSLYQALNNCDPILPSENPPQNVTNGNQRTSLLYLSPQVERFSQRAGAGDQGSPRRINANRRLSHSLNFFFGKVGRLAYQRIETLCNLLKIPNDLVLKIWTTFEYCIASRNYLLQNRHIDQVIMCCIFGICKVMEREIPFKNIVSMYRTMSHAEQKTYRRVEISNGEYKNVISFYNSIFLQDLKSYILRFTGDRQMPLTPTPRTPSRFSSPVYPVPGRQNFYVSPLKESPFKTPQHRGQMTPRTAHLYCFGEGNAEEKFKMMTDFVHEKTAGKTPTKNSSKRLDFDSQSDPQDGTSDTPVPVKRIANLKEQSGSSSGQ